MHKFLRGYKEIHNNTEKDETPNIDNEGHDIEVHIFSDRAVNREANMLSIECIAYDSN